VLVKVAVALARFGRDRQNVPEKVGNDALGRRMKARDFNLFLVGSSVPDEGMAVAGGGPRAEVDVIDCSARRLRVGASRPGGGVLRTGRLKLHSHDDRGCTHAQNEGARFRLMITHCWLP